jgi:alkanesulfonate monooxygenase SsuD/methylene tetrahydromethanopterin reductase-like flavin-dependent oxidoreductase (luciferase family)
VRPAQERVPILIGGHGRRVLALAARYADIVQFTGMTYGAGGTPRAGGFAVQQIAERADWLTELGQLAGRSDDAIERSTLVQLAAVGPHAPAADEIAARFEIDPEVVADTPFILSGSTGQVVDKLQRLRERLGLSHVVIRDAEAFAPVVEALAGR